METQMESKTESKAVKSVEKKEKKPTQTFNGPKVLSLTSHVAISMLEYNVTARMSLSVEDKNNPQFKVLEMTEVPGGIVVTKEDSPIYYKIYSSVLHTAKFQKE